MRVAALADVHGSASALEAVLADVAGAGVEPIGREEAVEHAKTVVCSG
ncbi:MAG: hypothetical protein M3P41_13800 [Actinomycetota bacterium]|nr:hypothetical protein [Actinomycetota bacterium]